MASTIAVAQCSPCWPFQDRDIFKNSLQFMGYVDFFSCARVCQLWNQFSNNHLILQEVFKNEGIPLVEKEPNSNLKEEFRILYLITISKKMGEKIFGKFPEELPCISRQRFEELKEWDPFEPEKLKLRTFKIVVIPSVIERTSCAEFPYILDQQGRLQLVEPGQWTGETLLIPNTIPNRKILGERPLSDKKNMPVFHYFPDYILNQCNTHPDKISLYFMRIDIVGRNMHYPEQKAFVEGHGFEVTSLETRSYFNEVSIFTSGTCPDVLEPRTYACTSTAVVLKGNTYQSTIGAFDPSLGASVAINRSGEHTGVATGRPAEVPR